MAGGLRTGAALSLPFLAFAVFQWSPAALAAYAGRDFELYRDAASRFLAGGPFYPAWQLAGPYGAEALPILYPPQILALLEPFTVLPAVLWWAIPIGVVAAVVAYWRPSPLVWPVIAACLAWPATSIKIVTGNPVLWVAAFVALGTVYRWPAAFALLKPTLAPFALVGVHDRRWWLAAALGALPFCWLLPEYFVTLRNFVSPAGLAYSVQEIPLVAIPLIAWASRLLDRAQADRVLVRGRRAREAAPVGNG